MSAVFVLVSSSSRSWIFAFNLAILYGIQFLLNEISDVVHAEEYVLTKEPFFSSHILVEAITFDTDTATKIM